MGTLRVWRNRLGLSFFTFCLIGVSGCGGSSEESAPDPLTGVETRPSSPSSSVLAGREIGMIVTGKGANDSNRSLEVLEQQIFSFLSALREVYDRERAQEPSLLGSLEVQMTIEPGGRVSDLRFPSSRIVSEKLLSAIFDEMRAWTFPPAEESVQLRYRLLLIPPGIDHASILLWEKHLGTLRAAERAVERPATITTLAPSPELTAEPSLATPEPEPEMATASDTAPGWYRVTRPTTLYAAPREASDIVSILRPGTRVHVVGIAAGDWLEVRSVTDRPPGFLHRADAVLESEWEGQ